MCGRSEEASSQSTRYADERARAAEVTSMRETAEPTGCRTKCELARLKVSRELREKEEHLKMRISGELKIESRTM